MLPKSSASSFSLLSSFRFPIFLYLLLVCMMSHLWCSGLGNSSLGWRPFVHDQRIRQVADGEVPEHARVGLPPTTPSCITVSLPKAFRTLLPSLRVLEFVCRIGHHDLRPSPDRQSCCPLTHHRSRSLAIHLDHHPASRQIPIESILPLSCLLFSRLALSRVTLSHFPLTAQLHARVHDAFTFYSVITALVLCYGCCCIT